MKFGQLLKYDMSNIFIGHAQNVVKKLVPEHFSKKQN